jgi:hypothetical protein
VGELPFAVAAGSAHPTRPEAKTTIKATTRLLFFMRIAAPRFDFLVALFSGVT